MADATFATAAQGSQFQPVYLGRKMKVYPVYQSDLEGLEVYAGIITISIAVITLIAGFAMTIWWDWETSAAVGSPKESYGLAVLVICCAVVIGCVIALCMSWKKKNNVLTRIEKESYELNAAKP